MDYYNIYFYLLLQVKIFQSIGVTHMSRDEGKAEWYIFDFSVSFISTHMHILIGRIP